MRRPTKAEAIGIGIGIALAIALPIACGRSADLRAGYAPDARQTALAEREASPREIAYVSTRSGKATIWLADEYGGNETELTPDHPGTIDIAWSADGQTLYFASQMSDNLEMHDLEKGRHHIYALDMASGQVRQLTNHPSLNRYPDASPDGKTVVFLSDRETGGRQVWAMRPDGSGQRRITDSAGHKSRPTYSPDGELLALQANCPTAQIYLMQPDGTRMENISNNRFSERYPSWSGDGQELTFTSIRSGPLVETSVPLKAWTWLQQLFTGRGRAVYVMSRSGDHQRLLVQMPGESKHADYSADGRRIVFEGNCTGRDQIYVVNPDGSALRQLTFEGTNFKPVFRPRVADSQPASEARP